MAPPGTGTAADPYRITELGHLVWMGNNAGSSAGTYYALSSDIDAAGTANWNDTGTDGTVLEGFGPIGTEVIPFGGVFDGQGHAIGGLTINRPSGLHVGLFGRLGASAAVRNLGLEGGFVAGSWAVGGLAGENVGAVEQCYATGTVVGGGAIGGLLGLNRGTVEQCNTTGGVTGTSVTGGLVGSNDGTVRQCYATGALTGGATVGGLLGDNRGSAEFCYATGLVAGTDFSGGLLGFNDTSGVVRRCYAAGAVTGAFSVGGLTGFNRATLEECHATGAVTGQYSVGGLVGRNDGAITRCYATGAATGVTSVGGLVAYNHTGVVGQCYSTGAVTGASTAGGLVGFCREWEAVSQCYWDLESSGWTTSAGSGSEGKTTAQMREQSTYVGWAFPDAWGISPGRNDGLPYLLRDNPWLVRFLAGAHGALTGATSQWVADGQDTTPVTAVPAYLFLFDQWSDGSAESPRALAAVSSDVELTASFRPAGPAASPDGMFRAVLDATEVARGRGLWDVTGTYPTSVAGSPLTLSLVHDSGGRLSGTAAYTVAKGTVITMPIRGSVKGSRGSITMKGTMRGADSGKAVAVALLMDLALETANHRLVGRLTGSIKVSGATALVNDGLILAIPAPMDGTWTLALQLGQTGRAVTGEATLRLSNGVTHTFAVGGRTGANRTAALSLAGDPTDPAAKSLKVDTTITRLEGGWARLESFSGRGYGQVLAW